MNAIGFAVSVMNAMVGALHHEHSFSGRSGYSSNGAFKEMSTRSRRMAQMIYLLTLFTAQDWCDISTLSWRIFFAKGEELICGVSAALIVEVGERAKSPRGGDLKRRRQWRFCVVHGLRLATAAALWVILNPALVLCIVLTRFNTDCVQGT